MFDYKEEKFYKDLSDLVNTILRNNQAMIDKIDASHAEFLKMFPPKSIEEQKDCSISSN